MSNKLEATIKVHDFLALIYIFLFSWKNEKILLMEKFSIHSQGRNVIGSNYEIVEGSFLYGICVVKVENRMEREKVVGPPCFMCVICLVV